MALTLKQEAFVDEYFKQEGNCYAAAIAAGYSKATAKEANKWINEQTLKSPHKKRLYKPEIAAAIDERREQLKSERVADAQEIMEFHTAVLRNEITEKVVVITGDGDGMSSAGLLEKPPSIKDRQGSADTLAKILGIISNKVEVGGTIPVVISGGEALDD